MKIPFTNREVVKRSAPPITGAVMKPVRVMPNEAPLMRAMTDLSARLARDASEHNEKMFRSYDAGGGFVNFDPNIKGTYGTANTEIFSFFYKIWARVRTLAKDTPHGKAIVRTYKNNIVGHDPFSLTLRVGKNTKQPHPETGEMVTVFVPEEDLNRQVPLEWKKFLGHKNFTIRKTISALEGGNQMVSEIVTIGSVIIRLWRGYPGNKYGFAIDILEADRLQPNYNGRAPGSNNPIRGSIEYDPTWNFPVAYWLLTRHPGEYVGQRNYPGGASGEVMRERVPAEDIIHYNNLRDRAEQDLGFTELEACVQSIYSNFQYAKALTVASLASACKPWVIEKNTPTGLSYAPSKSEFEDLMGSAEQRGMDSLKNQGLGGNNTGDVPAQQGIVANTEAMSPAMTKVLEWGFTMKVLDPKFPIEAASTFRMDNNKEIATAAGISYSALTGDFQSLGYIAAQMSKQPERDNFMVHQAHMIDVVWSEIFKAWLKCSVMAGVFDIPMARLEEVCDAAKFKPKRWPFTDALREVQAMILKKDARMVSAQQIQDEMPDGIDYTDVVAQISEERLLETSHGLPLMDVDPTEAKDTEDVAGPEDEQAGAKTTPASRPAKPSGSKTAKGQTVKTTGKKKSRSRIAPEVLALIDEVDTKNGLHE